MDEQADAVTGLVLVEQVLEILHRVDIFTIDLDDQVPLFDPGCIGFAVGRNADNDDPRRFFDIKPTGNFRGDLGNLKAVFAIFLLVWVL